MATCILLNQMRPFFALRYESVMPEVSMLQQDLCAHRATGMRKNLIYKFSDEVQGKNSLSNETNRKADLNS